MYYKTVLPNQLRIITHDMRERDSVAIGLLVGAGGRHEEDRTKGAAHFLEHIMFKGSRKYTCDDIKEKIEGVGGSLNAFTTEEITCYFAKIPAQHVQKTFDILSDMVFYPLVMKKDVEKEKGVIIEEIKMYRDLPQYLVLELLDSLLWPEHPLGKNLTGTPETVSQMTNGDLKDFHRQHYSGRNVVISASGNIKHQEFVKIVKKKLGKIPKGNTKDFLKANHSQDHPKTFFFRKDIEQMHLALGILGLHDEHADKYTLALLHVILGGNMSSRLFNQVREKRGLAYSISTSMKTFRDTGLFMVRAGVDNNKIVEAVDVIIKELKKIKRNGVTQDEFSRAKDYYLGQVLLGLEDTLDHMLWIGDSILLHNYTRTLKDIIQIITNIRIDDIRRVAVDIIHEKRFNLAIVGPVTDKQEENLNRLLHV